MTPMLRQYWEVKKQYNDCILFFRLGDFYEMFGEDAKEASKILNITLTARNKGTANEIAMCGIPYHAAEGYTAKLTRVGKRVAICEQMTQPNGAGIVEREVVRIVTPGTTLDNNVLESKLNNYIVSIDIEKGNFGLSYVDVTTGEFKVTENNSEQAILDEINLLGPSEILITQAAEREAKFLPLLQDISLVQTVTPSGFETPSEVIAKAMGVESVHSFGIEDLKIGQRSVANILNYLKETQKTNLAHLRVIVPYLLDETMMLDRATIRNLELFHNNHSFTAEGSLISVIDKTVTPMGGRLLRHVLAHPLLKKIEIEQRLTAVDELVQSFEVRELILQLLKEVSDVERLIGRIGCNRFSARDFSALRATLLLLPKFKEQINKTKSLKLLSGEVIELPKLYNLLEFSIADEPPALTNSGGMIRMGYNSELDELRALSTTGKDYIAQMQAREIERSGISSLKIKFNNVFGYYIEISKANSSQVPSDYERKQTLVNAERFTIPELKEYEQKVLSADERIKELEFSLLMMIREEFLQYLPELSKLSKQLSIIDLVYSFAELAKSNRYCKPEITNGYDLKIVNGRHPVIEMIGKDRYIPNDVIFNEVDHQLILLTGPNMAGKSSYLRQIALITLMAQIGSFVPAESATIGVCDHIFTRVGASDNLSQGQSTFMVEMQEAAYIINTATDKSLIIFDELGRGTSTYDGISIAWSVVSYIHDKLKSKTIFATHYHELIEMVKDLPYAKNYSVAVQETGGELLFLRKVVPQPIGKSYGIEVAKRAGLPKEIIIQAMETLKNLESKEKPLAALQQSIFGAIQEVKTETSPIIEKLKAVDIEQLTPIDALNKLKELQDEI